MLYLILIVGAMTVIAILNAIFNVYSLQFWYICLAVVINTVAVIAVDGVCATVVRRCLPQKWFGVDKTFFCATEKERVFYNKIGIHKWKDKIPELGMFTAFRKNHVRKPNDNEYLSRYILEANYGVVCHLVGAIVGYAIVFIYPIKFALCFGVPVATVNVLLNVPPTFILRYNLPKLHSLLKFNSRKKLLSKNLN